ncbi:hypothetical protein MMC07_000553 [Pseudocyphellaria aurata]|nr:hypothetical protein [Pseudocyphellaria aurata]
MADRRPPEHPLAVLPAMLNLVLVRTGKFFQNAASHDPKHLVHTTESITKAVTEANRKFHDALDEVEIEIIRAKSVMERDLAVLRSKRAERERAAGLLKARSPVEKSENTRVEQPGTRGEKPSSTGASNQPKPDDVIMIDAPEPKNQDLTNPKTKSKNPKPEKPTSALQGASRTAEGSKGLAISIDPYSEKAASAHNGGTKEDVRDDLPEQRLETPTTANLRDTDFETMFNDTETAGGDDGMNFHLNFDADASMNEQMANSTAYQNLAMNGQHDDHTLLPGLENYANVGHDFNLAPAKTLPASGSKAKTAPATTAAPQGFGNAQVDMSFDSLFPSDGFNAGSGGFDITGDGTVGDLSELDEWFKQE